MPQMSFPPHSVAKRVTHRYHAMVLAHREWNVATGASLLAMAQPALAQASASPFPHQSCWEMVPRCTWMNDK